MTQSFQLSAGVSSLNITNDSYLIIVYGEDKDNYSVVDFNSSQKQQAINSSNLLNKLTTQISTGVVGKVGMALYTSPIIQNVVGKNLPNSVVGRINSSLYDIMSDGKVSVVEVGESLISNCTNILDNMATDLGFPSPSGLYSAILPGGTGVPSKDFANLFSKNAKIENLLNKQKENNNLSEPQNVLKFKIVTKDSETLASDIPTRKTENGIYLASIIGNQNKTKDFTISIVNNPTLGINMYQVKKQLEDLRDTKEAFNMYVCDADVQNIEFFKHCVFSNININTEGKNSLNVDLSIVVIPEYKIIIDTNLPKSLKQTGSSSKGGSPRKNNPDKNHKDETSPTNTLNISKYDRHELSKIQSNARKYRDSVKTWERIKKAPFYIGAREFDLSQQERIQAELIKTSTNMLKKLGMKNANERLTAQMFESGLDFNKIGK